MAVYRKTVILIMLVLEDWHKVFGLKKSFKGNMKKCILYADI